MKGRSVRLICKWDDTAVQETLERLLLEIHGSRGADFVDDLLGDSNTELDTTVFGDGVKQGVIAARVHSSPVMYAEHKVAHKKWMAVPAPPSPMQ